MSDQIKAIIVYATFPDFETARTMADRLVRARHAACVNLLPAMTSLYRWRGAVETAQEVVMIIKTRAELSDDVVALIEHHHPYDTPAVIAIDITGGSHKYLEWIASETMEPMRPKP